MWLGILAGLTTCALWGLTFVAPRVVAPFTAWDLTIARYGIFGVACLALMSSQRFRPRHIGSRRACIGLLLGGAGYVGYFVCTAFAVQYAGATIPPVIIGTMPLLLAILANCRERAAPWHRLAFPIILTGAGVALVNVTAINSADQTGKWPQIIGIAASIGALIVWILYGLVNAAIMRSANPPDGLQWTGLQGIGAAIGSALLLPLVSFNLIHSAAAVDTVRFAAWAVVMGLAGSWFATWCWVVASQRLPLVLSAQLIVAETIFGLVYGYIYEARLPHTAEVLGATLQIVCVCWAVTAFTEKFSTRISASS